MRISSVEELSENLDTINSNDKLLKRAQVGETEFRRVYLPRFWYHGQIHPETKKPIEANLSDWIFNIAAGYFNEVDVISDTTGEVLFTVPPLGLQIGKSIGNVNYEVAEEKINLPSGVIMHRAAQELRQGINSKQALRNMDSIARMYSTTSKDENIEALRLSYLARWDAIFDRYVPNRRKTVKVDSGSATTDDFDDNEPLY